MIVQCAPVSGVTGPSWVMLMPAATGSRQYLHMITARDLTLTLVSTLTMAA